MADILTCLDVQTTQDKIKEIVGTGTEYHPKGGLTTLPILTKDAAFAGEAVTKRQLDLNGSMPTYNINAHFDHWQETDGAEVAVKNNTRKFVADGWWAFSQGYSATACKLSRTETPQGYGVKAVTNGVGSFEMRQCIRLTHQSKQITKSGKGTYRIRAKFPVGVEVRVMAYYAEEYAPVGDDAQIAENGGLVGVGTGDFKDYSLTFTDVTPEANRNYFVMGIYGMAHNSEYTVEYFEFDEDAETCLPKRESIADGLFRCQAQFAKIGAMNYAYETGGTDAHAHLYRLPTKMERTPVVSRVSDYLSDFEAFTQVSVYLDQEFNIYKLSTASNKHYIGGWFTFDARVHI